MNLGNAEEKRTVAEVDAFQVDNNRCRFANERAPLLFNFFIYVVFLFFWVVLFCLFVFLHMNIALIICHTFMLRSTSSQLGNYNIALPGIYGLNTSNKI